MLRAEEEKQKVKQEMEAQRQKLLQAEEKERLLKDEALRKQAEIKVIIEWRAISRKKREKKQQQFGSWMFLVDFATHYLCCNKWSKSLLSKFSSKV